MKTKGAILAVTLVLIIMGVVFVQHNRRSMYLVSKHLSVDDKEFWLVVKSGPLLIYREKGSSESNLSYIIMEGSKMLVAKEYGLSNTVTTSHFEDGNNVLTTKWNTNGRITERKWTCWNETGGLHYTYKDNDADGLWDVFFDFENRAYYVRQGLCWVPARSSNN